ncbi:MAG: hypothetical protein ACI9Y1_000343, partial [Lentisphaeria bacterium]
MIPENCENCGASLVGSYCHQCGQGVENNLRFFGDA